MCACQNRRHGRAIASSLSRARKLEENRAREGGGVYGPSQKRELPKTSASRAPSGSVLTRAAGAEGVLKPEQDLFIRSSKSGSHQDGFSRGRDLKKVAVIEIRRRARGELRPRAAGKSLVARRERGQRGRCAWPDQKHRLLGVAARSASARALHCGRCCPFVGSPSRGGSHPAVCRHVAHG